MMLERLKKRGLSLSDLQDDDDPVDVNEKRAAEASALAAALSREKTDGPMKICVMVRVRRLFDVSLADESFKVITHCITCWKCEGDALHDQVAQDFREKHAGKFIYDADPDKAF